MADRFLASPTAAAGSAGSSGDPVCDRGTVRCRSSPSCQSPRKYKVADQPRSELDPVLHPSASSLSAEKGSVRGRGRPKKAACQSPQSRDTEAKGTARGENQAVAAIGGASPSSGEGNSQQQSRESAAPAVESNSGWEPKSDPAGPLFSLDGAAVSEVGQLRRDEYFPFKEHFFGEAQDRKDHPDPRFPGLRASEVERRQNDVSFLAGLRMWCDANGAGWIASKPGSKKTTWFSMKTWGSWRFAYLLAKLQRDLWQREVDNAEKSSGDGAGPSASLEASPASSPSSVSMSSPGLGPQTPQHRSSLVLSSPSKCNTWGLDDLATPAKDSKQSRFRSPPNASSSSKMPAFSSPAKCNTWGLDDVSTLAKATSAKDSKQSRFRSPPQASTPERRSAKALDWNQLVDSDAFSSLDPYADPGIPANAGSVRGRGRPRKELQAKDGSQIRFRTPPQASTPQRRSAEALDSSPPASVRVQSAASDLQQAPQAIFQPPEEAIFRTPQRRSANAPTAPSSVQSAASSLQPPEDIFQLPESATWLPESPTTLTKERKRSRSRSPVIWKLPSKGASDASSSLDPYADTGIPASAGSVRGRGRPRKESQAEDGNQIRFRTPPQASTPQRRSAKALDSSPPSSSVQSAASDLQPPEAIFQLPESATWPPESLTNLTTERKRSRSRSPGIWKLLSKGAELGTSMRTEPTAKTGIKTLAGRRLRTKTSVAGLPQLRTPDPLALPVPHSAGMQARLRRLRSKTRVKFLVGRRRITGKALPQLQTAADLTGSTLPNGRPANCNSERSTEKNAGSVRGRGRPRRDWSQPGSVRGRGRPRKDRSQLGCSVANWPDSTGASDTSSSVDPDADPGIPANAGSVQGRGRGRPREESQGGIASAEEGPKRSNMEDVAAASQTDCLSTGNQLGASDASTSLDPDVETGIPANVGSVQGRGHGRPQKESQEGIASAEEGSKRSDIEDVAAASQSDPLSTGNQLGASDASSSLDPDAETGIPANAGSVRGRGRGRPRKESQAKALLDWLALLALVANTLETPDGRARFTQLLRGRSEHDVQLLVRKLRREEKHGIAEEVLRIFREMQEI